MATPDEIRQRIRDALADKDLTPITAVAAANKKWRLKLGRDYLRDFLEAKKESLTKGLKALADVLGLELADLLPDTPTPPPPVPSIRRGAKVRLYITEHMESRGWDDAYLAGRIEDATPELVKSWRLEQWRMQWSDVQALLHAFGMDDIAELARPPAPTSAARKPEKRPSKTIPRRRA